MSLSKSKLAMWCRWLLANGVDKFTGAAALLIIPASTVTWDLVAEAYEALKGPGPV